MKYEVRCECGKSFTVTGAEAGTSLPCACGKTVEVPPLHKLRTVRGETSVPILVRIRSEVHTGQLPGTRDCVLCRQPNAGLIRIAAACEQEPGATERSGAERLGCLLVPLFGWPLVLLGVVASQNARAGALDVSVVLPLPVCEACRTTLRTPDELQDALEVIPEYAALLREYPGSELSRFN